MENNSNIQPSSAPDKDLGVLEEALCKAIGIIQRVFAVPSSILDDMDAAAEIAAEIEQVVCRINSCMDGECRRALALPHARLTGDTVTIGRFSRESYAICIRDIAAELQQEIIEVIDNFESLTASGEDVQFCNLLEVRLMAVEPPNKYDYSKLDSKVHNEILAAGDATKEAPPAKLECRIRFGNRGVLFLDDEDFPVSDSEYDFVSCCEKAYPESASELLKKKKLRPAIRKGLPQKIGDLIVSKSGNGTYLDHTAYRNNQLASRKKSVA